MNPAPKEKTVTRTKKPQRWWRYEVDEVSGKVPVEVGTILIDHWKSDRTWRLYKIPSMKPLGWWHARLLGEVTDPEKIAEIENA